MGEYKYYLFICLFSFLFHEPKNRWRLNHPSTPSNDTPAGYWRVHNSGAYRRDGRRKKLGTSFKFLYLMGYLEIRWSQPILKHGSHLLLHFVAFFHVASSMLSTEVDNKKVGVDNEKALELENRIYFIVSYLMITPNILV